MCKLISNYGLTGIKVLKKLLQNNMWVQLFLFLVQPPKHTDDESNNK